MSDLSKFWSKCGKILMQDGKIIRSDGDPSGYWTVIGIKYRWLNSDTMEPSNECSWQYHVSAYYVIENKIQWNYMYSVCLPVVKQKGLCCHKKIREGCWEDCAEWNEDWTECIKTREICDFCVELYAYNIGGCFDDYKKFQEEFYSKCGVSPDTSGNYPQVFEESYGQTYMSGSAQSCVDGYWNRYFCDLYMLNYSLNYTNHEQRWWQYVAYQKNVMYTWSFCWNDTGDNVDPDESGNCPEGYTKEEYSELDHIESIGGIAWQEQCNDAWDQSNSLYVKAGGWYGTDDKHCRDYPCYHETCQDYNASLGTTGATGAFIMSESRIKEKYCNKGNSTHTCNDSNSLCTNWSYSASCWDNYYWDPANARFHFGWSIVTLRKNSVTPDYAKGVKFEVTLKRTKTNSGKGNKSVSTTEQKFMLSLMFDQEYKDLPLLDHINTMNVIQGGHVCDSDGNIVEYKELITEPAVNWGGHEQNVLSDNMDVSFVAKEYIK